MTIAATTFTRFDAIGVKEELSNRIYNIAPTETPFISNAGVKKAKNTQFDWQTDDLATPVSTNQQLEGDEITTYDAVTPTVRPYNYCQIMRKTVSISETEQEVDKAGRDDELAYQVAKKSKELKRDMEKDFLENKGASAGSTVAARISASLCAFVKTNVSKDAGGVNPVWTTIPSDVRTDGTQRAFTETINKAVLLLGFNNGADFSTLMVGGFNKQVVSGFSGVVELTANQRSGQATIIGAADTYISDYGELKVVPNRFQRARDAWYLDWGMVSLRYLRAFKAVPLAKTGDADKRLLRCEVGLAVNNEKGLGLAADLSTS